MKEILKRNIEKLLYEHFELDNIALDLIHLLHELEIIFQSKINSYTFENELDSGVWRLRGYIKLEEVNTPFSIIYRNKDKNIEILI